MASFVGKVGILWITECGQTCVPSPPGCYNPNTGTKHWPSSSSTSSSSLPSRVFRTSSLATINKINILRGRERRGQGEGFSIIRASTAENMATETTTTNTGEVVEKLGVQIHRNPPESKLAQLGVRNWPKWGCPPSKFPWTYSSKETCYLLKGKVKVYPDGSDEGVEIGAGDLVEFPNGMSCTWDVSEAVDKHYKFD